MRAHIIGTGSYVPEKVVTNHDLEKLVETTDEWIVERTGIRERRMAAPGENTSDMALKAAIRALEMASTRADELDLVIVGTVTPDMPMPACAAFLAHKLGATKAFAFDLSAACAGSLFGLSVASQFIETGKAKRVLVVGVELLTRIIDWKDRNTCVLFGDAAGAMVLGPSKDDTRGIISTHLHTDGAQTGILCIPGGGSKTPVSHEMVDQRLQFVSMNGRDVYKFAVRALSDAIGEAFAANNLTPDHITHIVAHQANVRIIDAVLERVKLPKEKAFLNIDKYGNTSSASLPMTLDEANRSGRLAPNDTILMMAIGAGMSWGSAIVRW
ncbi:MAG: beta-ketoacyl-ACP synthase III [Myxococcales bacterium]|nr:beta-ketoacyl-ACP synthase III [Myxococcales bacterium]